VHQRRKVERESASAACACTAEAANPCRWISVGVTPIEGLPSYLGLYKASSDQRRAIRSGQESAASKSKGSAIRSRSLRLTIDSAITALRRLNPWTTMNGPLDHKRERARGRDPRLPLRKILEILDGNKLKHKAKTHTSRAGSRTNLMIGFNATTCSRRLGVVAIPGWLSPRH
jgi:hypothetical protein